MTNYKFIVNEVVTKDFINSLPELEQNEVYFVILFARKKYVPNFYHITNKETSVKRFVATKQNLFKKLKQLECALGSYTTKSGVALPQEIFTVHINMNPRCQNKAAKQVAKNIIDISFASPQQTMNLHNMTLSELQTATSKKRYFDFDFDGVDINVLAPNILKFVNKDCVKFLETRGGVHVIVEISKVEPQYTKSWFLNITSIEGCDKKCSSDKTTPIPGSYQGGFMPHFVEF
jgi:hypothetical protein